MLARRIARRLIVPAAYAVVAVLLVTGLWPHVAPRLTSLGTGATTATAPRSTGGSDRVASNEYDASDGQPTDEMQVAIESVRRFSDEPSLQLEGGLRTDGGDRRAYYYLESVRIERGEDVFKVDAATDEVIEATFRSRLTSTLVPLDLSFDDAAWLAERYARARFAGFEALALVDRATRPNDTVPVYSFKWTRVATSGAELPLSVSVAVSSSSGEVIWYLAQRDPLTVDVMPTVTRERAIETARNWVGDRDLRWDTSVPSAVRLQVLYDDDDEQQLVWSISFSGGAGAERPSLRLLVDAHNGRILTPAS